MNIPIHSRVFALLAYLVVTRQPQSRSTLANLLWDHQSEQEAKTNLRYILRDLRKAIGDYLITDGQIIAFNQTLPHWCDVTSFAHALSSTTALAPAQADPILVQEVLTLYQGDFLAGFHIQDALNFEDWMLAQRNHYQDIMVYGLQLMTEQHLSQGNYEAGLALNQYLLTLEPWREEAHRQRMLLLAMSGQRSAALMQYDLCCKTLEEELDVPPMNETTSLYHQIKSGRWFLDQHEGDSRHSPSVAVRAYPQAAPILNKHNAAQPIGSTTPTSTSPVDFGSMPTTSNFIGRLNELALLHRWFTEDHCRLLAVLGLAGQGKSALAAYFVQQQAAAIQASDETLVHGAAQHVANWPLPPMAKQAEQTKAADGVTRIIWRSLAPKPTCIEILQDWVRQLRPETHTPIPTNFDQLVTQLFTLLERQRSLLVLDGVEAILQGTGRAAQSEMESYEHLFRLFVERHHKSCLLLTSRLRPAALTHLPKRCQLTHCLELTGLQEEESGELLRSHGLNSDLLSRQQLHQQYAGNPRLLSQAADLIYNLFSSDVAAFVQEEIYFLGELGAAFTEQFTHLSTLEWQIIQALARDQHPISRQTLWERLTLSTDTPVDKEEYYHALHQLRCAHLLHQEQGQFILATLTTRYLTYLYNVTS